MSQITRNVALFRLRRYTGTMNKNIVVVACIGVLTAVAILLWAWLYFAVGGSIGGFAGLAMRAGASLVMGGALAFLGIALWQRIAEIKKGEEDDLGDY